MSLAKRLRAVVRFDEIHERITRPHRQTNHARIIASSNELGWEGLHLEVGTNTGCDIDELMVNGHYVGLHLNDRPITISTRTAGHWCDTIMVPHSLWIHPEGTPFSARHSSFSHWAAAVIDGAFLDSVMGRHHELQASVIVEDKLLTHSLFALIDQLMDIDPRVVRNTSLSSSLIHSFVLALGSRQGVPAIPLPQNGGIAPWQIKALRIWLGENIGSALSVEAMAARVGLSVAHFAREFKRSTGVTPWNYVVELRVNLARELLLQGNSANGVALRCGFADQSHLCRAIRAHFGVSPREIAMFASRRSKLPGRAEHGLSPSR